MRKFAFCAAALCGWAAVPASAQYSPVTAAIGNTIANMAAADGREHNCMMGEAVSQDKVAAARAGAEAVIRQYLRAAGSSPAADVSALFGSKPRHRLWTAGGAQKPVTAVDDAFARRVAAGEAAPTPTAIVRSGDGESALGLWALRPAGGGDPIGYYQAALRREGGMWKLSRLELFDAAAAPAAPTQYCHRPGDVEPYVAAVAEAKAARERKKAEKAARKAREAAKQGRSGG